MIFVVYIMTTKKNAMCGYIVYADGKRVSSVVSYSIACDIAEQCRAAGRRYVIIQKSF